MVTEESHIHRAVDKEVYDIGHNFFMTSVVLCELVLLLSDMITTFETHEDTIW